MSADTVVRARIDSEYKGNLIGAGRRSARDSLFDDAIPTFEEDACAYDQKDAEGFI